MGDHVYVCTAESGLVVPTKEGGQRTLKAGDEVTGEYYEKIAERSNMLVLKSSLSKKALDELTRLKKLRGGQSFQEIIADRDPNADFNPRLDCCRSDASQNFAAAVRESRGATKAAVPVNNPSSASTKEG